MSLRARVLTGFRWSAGARLMSQAITWVITLVVVRLLSPADYGLLAMAMVFVSFLTMLSEFGLGAAVVQQSAMEERLLQRVFGIVLSVHGALAILLALAAPLIAAFYGEPRVIPVIQVLSLQFVVAAFGVIPDAALQRRLEFRNRSVVDFCGSVLGSITTLGVAVAGYGVWALVAGTMVTQILRTVGLNILQPYFHRPEFSLKELKGLLRFGGHVTAGQVLWACAAQVDVLICGRWLGHELLGFYAVAMHIASLPTQRISAIVNQVAFPAFSGIQHDLPRVGSHVLLGTRVLSIVAFPLSWGLSSVAPELVETLLGEKWAPAAFPLQVLALVMPMRFIGNFVQVAVQGVGRSDIPLSNAIWAIAITPFAFFAGVQAGGFTGLILAWLITAPIVFLQAILRGIPVIGVRFSALAFAMMPAAGAGLTMYGAVAAARLALGVAEAGVVRLAILIAVGAVTYCAASIVVNRKGSREMFEMVRGVSSVKQAYS